MALQSRKLDSSLEESTLGTLTKKTIKRISGKVALRTYGMTTLNNFVYEVSA
jgi:hypothetical protein